MAFSKIFKAREKRRKLVERRAKGGQERAKSGLEMEMFLIDHEGNIANDADRILKEAEKKKLEIDLKKECTKSVVEVGVVPRIYVRNLADRVLTDVLSALDIIEEKELGVFPLAVYPARYEPEMRKGPWYGIKENIFGADKWPLAGRCTGFHFHYSLPSGIFGEDKFLVTNAKRMDKQRALNEYNLALACDPATTLFTQSSPIHNGMVLGKDVRLFLYRGGKDLRYDGLYSKFPLFGALPEYAVEYSDLIYLAERRYKAWSDTMLEAGAKKEAIEEYYKLDFTWAPLKVNKVGTIELRGMDMNFPSVLLATAILVKYALKNVQREDIEVVPSTVAVKEPFLFEDNKIYVPPFWYVSSRLQYQSARYGLADDEVKHYSKRFYAFCMQFVNKKYHPAIRPLKRMLKEDKTVSDRVLDEVRKRGFSAKEEIPDGALREIVLHFSSRFRKDVEKTQKLMKSLEEGDRRAL